MSAADRMILNDICALSCWLSHIHKAGAGGGVFIMDSYKPYNNTLTRRGSAGNLNLIRHIIEESAGKD